MPLGAFIVHPLFVPFGTTIHRIWRGITMKNFAAKISSFLKSEDGPTAVEYAVMLALIVVVCLGAIRTIGTNASTTFNKVSQQLK
jgi:pilus assembly protein Flp/PilA